MFIIGKGGGGGTELRSHVADGGLTRTGDGIGTRPKVFKDSVGAACAGEFAKEVEDHIFWCGPALQLSCEVDADEFWMQHFPGYSNHHIHGIGTANP